MKRAREDSAEWKCDFAAPEPCKIAVLGGGAFGTAMAVVAARNHHEVLLWARNAEQVAAINNTHKNPRAKKLEEYDLPHNIVATNDLQKALVGASLIIHALPAQTSPDWLAEHKDLIPEGTPLCITSKGLHVKTQSLLSEAITKAMGRPDQALAFLSGPSFAQEMVEQVPTAVVVASRLLYHAVHAQRLLSNINFRVYTTQDVIGVQLGGSLKNPLAIGAGMIEGMGLGINTMAFYITRCQRELMLLCEAMGGNRDTIAGLSGVGDLMLTAFGSLSRNRTCGMRLVKGEKLSDILSETTVEGVPTASVAVYYADKCGLELPLFRLVDAILSGKMNVEDAQKALMGRPLGKESKE